MKRNVKALTAAVLAAVMCAVFSGCDNRSELEKQIESAAKELEDYEKSSSKTSASSSKPSPKELDPFEELKVTFEGIAPNSSVKLSGKSSYVKYTLDKESGVKNGDKVTVSAELSPAYEDTYTLTSTEKEYTVEGLSSYAASLDEIPESVLEKIRAQADELITAEKLRNTSSMNESGDNAFKQESAEFAGYYFLSGKENTDAKPYNKICCVYKMKYSVTAYEYDEAREGKRRTTDELSTGYQEFYTLCELSDIILLSDGVCSFDSSSMKITRDSVVVGDEFANGYGYKLNGFMGYSWKGYNDLDTLFNKNVTVNLDKYGYESTVKDIPQTDEQTENSSSDVSS